MDEATDIFNNIDADYIKTGFTDFDNKFLGLPRKALTIIAGLPSMGKSMLATQIALNIAKQKKNVLFFSLEQSKEETIKKVLSNLTCIDSYKINSNKLTEEEKERINNEIKQFKDNYNLFINDNGKMDCFEIEKEIIAFKKKYNDLDVVIVDHLQITQDTNKEKVDYIKYGNITRDMKILAKKYNIVFICLSQLSRSVFENKGDRPELHNLKASGDIEANADVIIFTHRDNYFLEKKAQGTTGEEKKGLDKLIEASKNTMFLLVKKNRNGELGDIKLFVDLPKQKINNYFNG